MGILKSLSVRNFKCFRAETRIVLAQSTYLVGPNNSGKTALLEAVRCFFDDEAFHPGLIHKTELAAKKEGFNRSDITLVFDIGMVAGETRKKRMLGHYGKELAIKKSFTWREASDSTQIEYVARTKTYRYEQLPKDVREMLEAVSISYIHPQEGAELLERAQEKFKERLFHNWGRHASVGEKVNAVQEKWETLRSTANTYLSSALSQRLRAIWPNAEVKVDLPARIQDVVAISDITFRSSPNLPQITLPSHGTGAQSAILYQTHYVLDSDRSLHTGPYYPVWLLEEPESFLHADLAMQLSRLLSSSEWLERIQMMISTHSPLVLAGSHQNAPLARWVLTESHALKWEKAVVEVNPEDLVEVGRMLGDANLPIYFDASRTDRRVFLEDSSEVVQEKFKEAGISGTEGLDGVTTVKRYIDVLSAVGPALGVESYFMVDSDAGRGELERIIAAGTVVDSKNGWNKIRVTENLFLITLPEGMAVEGLFEEWQDVLDGCVSDIFDDQMRMRDSIPRDLTRAAVVVRGKELSRAEATAAVRNKQDVKDRFWARVRKHDWSFREDHVEALRELVPPVG